MNRHTPLTGLDKTDQGVLDEFNELYRNSRATVAKHKGELGEGDVTLVEDYLKKAATGEFGDHIFNDLKKLFTDLSEGDDKASK